MNPIIKSHIEAWTIIEGCSDNVRRHYAITKETAIAFLQFFRKYNWLHEFKSEEQLWEDFNKDLEKQKGCPFDEPIYNPEKV